MDEKLLRRLQAAGAMSVGISYFLPWASIISAFGEIQLRGVHVDMLWIVLVLAISHLIAQFSEVNRESLGIPEAWIGYIEVFKRNAPLVFIAFFSWYGVGFFVSAQGAPARTSLLGVEVSTLVRAGLDYGYWLGGIGAIVLLFSVGLEKRVAPQFASMAILVMLVFGGLAFGYTSLGVNSRKETTVASSTPSVATATPSKSTEPAVPEPEIDLSPYVEVVSITGKHYGKDAEAGRYRSSVVIAVVFKNSGTKAIVGLRGRLSVLDGFGKEAYGFNFRADDKLLAGKQSSRYGGYSFEDNQFDDDEPYDKMVPLISGGTARYSAKVTQIAFDDGSVLPASAGAAK